ncbi:putative DNA binding protein [Hibiscus syriacus]|uniref:DNA binding protein n=1 Tax=Hibiscus syriacus TaxID=106335 RepID=A0A6A3ANH7_HIBSY|nr:putative DNA binding protein [Hibiscus syriacus]
MASACVNNIGVPPESFQFGWLNPRVSFSREEETSSKEEEDRDSTKIQDVPAGEFEFRLVDPAAMLPADELFSDGKLMPLHFSAVKPHGQERRHRNPSLNAVRSREASSSCPGLEMEVSGSDHYLFSPKAPRCSSRWRQLLGLKKCSTTNTNTNHHQQQVSSKSDSQSSKISLQSNNNPKSLKHFLHRSSKSSSSLESSLSLPLLKSSDSKSVAISASRLSLSSSSSSGHEHDDFPRLSLDADKPSPNPFAPSRTLNPNPIELEIFFFLRVSLSLPLLKSSDSKSVAISASRLSLSSSSSSGHEHDDFPRLSLDADKPSPNPFAPSRTLNPNPPRMRMVKPRPGSGSDGNQTGAGGARVGRIPIRRERTASRGVSVDSPRMNSSGKIVFESLERSSSSPSSFNGGPSFKQRGVERSYSANVRITPVLNVPFVRTWILEIGFGFRVRATVLVFPAKESTGNQQGPSN